MLDREKVAMTPICLNGKSLSLENIVNICQNHHPIVLDSAALTRMQQAHRVYIDYVQSGSKVYGGNTYVGSSKDTSYNLDESSRANIELLRSHAITISDRFFSEVSARAMLLTRLNVMLNGYTGMRPEIAQMLANLLNHHLYPAIPLDGSIGMDDIIPLAFVGLVMAGEWYFLDRKSGEKLPAEETLKAKNIQPITYTAGDGLGLINNNSAAGLMAIALVETQKYLRLANGILALSFEAFKGHLTILDPGPKQARSFPGNSYIIDELTRYLDGSYLWEVSGKEDLQDPLSFRTSCSIHGGLYNALNQSLEMVLKQINHSDDSPCVLIEENRVISCGNFAPFEWLLPFQSVLMAMSYVCDASASRIINFNESNRTGLSRKLKVEGHGCGIETLQHLTLSLDQQVKEYSLLLPPYSRSLEEGIENVATYTTALVNKHYNLLQEAKKILTLELMAACQAWDLRKLKEPDIHLSQYTRRLYDSFRCFVPFYHLKHSLTDELTQAFNAMESGEFLQCLDV